MRTEIFLRKSKPQGWVILFPLMFTPIFILSQLHQVTLVVHHPHLMIANIIVLISIIDALMKSIAAAKYNFVGQNVIVARFKYEFYLLLRTISSVYVGQIQ